MKQPEDIYTAELNLSVTDRSPQLPGRSHLVLSLFPGVDLLGRGFEEEGYCVVRGPDRILAGDIRQFHSVPGRFDGVIGGPPCQDFSRARRDLPTGYGLEMLEQYRRVVMESRPTWWLMENVSGVPNMVIDGYSHQRIDINASECGLKQNRLRHFQFGHVAGKVITVDRLPSTTDVQPCCTASEFNQPGRRTWAEFCALQGVEPLDLDQFTQSARYRAVGNGVPVPMARVMARAISNARHLDGFRVCACGCGRSVYGKALTATPACRKRQQRKRESVIDQVLPTAVLSHWPSHGCE